MARKPYIPDDPSTLFDFELGDEHRLREPAGHRGQVQAQRRDRRESPGEGRPQSQSLFGNPRWISSISSFSFLWQKPRSYSYETHSTAGPGVWYYLPCSGSERGGPERDFGPSR